MINLKYLTSYSNIITISESNTTINSQYNFIRRKSNMIYTYFEIWFSRWSCFTQCSTRNTKDIKFFIIFSFIGNSNTINETSSRNNYSCFSIFSCSTIQCDIIIRTSSVISTTIYDTNSSQTSIAENPWYDWDLNNCFLINSFSYLIWCSANTIIWI